MEPTENIFSKCDHAAKRYEWTSLPPECVGDSHSWLAGGGRVQVGQNNNDPVAAGLDDGVDARRAAANADVGIRPDLSCSSAA